MKRKLSLRRSARDEFDRAAEWYDRERTGLGREFVIEIEVTFDRIRQNPEWFARVRGEVRAAPVDRFPYVIYFRWDGSVINVVSVFHTARNPSVWQNRR